MIPPLSVDNLLSWLLQVSIIALLGALLPLVFRIRHPRSQLVYCHVVLVSCLLLPLTQAWHDPLVVMAGASANGPSDLGFRISWGAITLGVIFTGIAAKLFWLAIGLRQIRGYRKASSPVWPIPDSIKIARKLTRADANFRISSSVSGAATLGYVDPVILLPESFASLESEAQQSIACHELLHVRRNDWLVTVAEEVVGALFWFNPAVRWLLSQAKLSREELVDAEVVGMTAAPGPYIQALLSMAETPRRLKISPAALFLAEGHLTRRVHSLLRGQTGSLGRLFVSYGSIAGLLALAAWCACTFFPLIGEVQVVAALAPAPPVFVPSEIPKEVPLPQESSILRSTFNLRVPEPDPPADTLFYARLNAPSFLFVERPEGLLPRPPLPPSPPESHLIERGVRVVRLGDKPAPEEIALMQAALGERAFVEVTQSEDGTVQRIIIQRRRSPDETIRIPSYFFVGPAGADPAGASDSVH